MERSNLKISVRSEKLFKKAQFKEGQELKAEAKKGSINLRRK